MQFGSAVETSASTTRVRLVNPIHNQHLSQSCRQSVSPSKTPIKTENRDKSPGIEVDLNNAGQVGRPDNIPVSPILSGDFLLPNLHDLSAWLNQWAERFQAQQQYAAALTRAIRFPLQAPGHGQQLMSAFLQFILKPDETRAAQWLR
jgi:hypothetical protein